MPFQLSHVVLHPAFSQIFTVLRSSGDWINGRWTEGTVTKIEMTGVVSVASEKDLQILPEADRVSGMMVFHSVKPLYITRIGTEKGTSDKIIWKGQEWKLKHVWDYSDYGYYKAYGERILGA